MNTPSIYARRTALVEQAMTSGLGAGMHPRISIKGGRFSLIDAGGTMYPWQQLILPVIIIGANPVASKIYYERDWNEDSSEPPTCFSDNGIAPSINAGYKQARTCAECPHFAWGSAHSKISGKPTKACADKKKIAVLVLGDQAGHAYELQIPPASLRNLNAYGGLISSRNTPDNSRKADVSDVITLVEFDAQNPNTLTFRNWGWIESVGPGGQICHTNGNPIPAPDGGAWIVDTINEIVDSGTIDELVGLNDQPFQAPAGFIGAAQQPAQVTYEPQPQGGQLQRGSYPQGGQRQQPQHSTQQMTHQPAAQPPVQPHNPWAGPPGATAAAPHTMAQAQPQAAAPRQARKRNTGTTVATQPAPSNVAPFPAGGPQQGSPFGGGQPFPAQVSGGAPDTAGGDIPNFLRRDQGGAPMTDPPAPTADLSKALGAAFALNTQQGQ